VAGENVYSVIVEAAIFEHPDVADCAVVGYTPPHAGRRGRGVVVLRPGRVIEAEEITRSRRPTPRPKFEVPTRIFFRAEPLPRNPSGQRS
jgi:long-chain acyl-CoA synthetase